MKTEKRKAELAAYQAEYRKKNLEKMNAYSRVRSLAYYHKKRNSMTDDERESNRIKRAAYKKQYKESLTDEQRAAAKANLRAAAVQAGAAAGAAWNTCTLGLKF